MKKIKIAEPCHENWNDFTPTQRGAFCGSCQINVIDFSSKSNHEIKDILVENSGKKMCGRFSKTQLDDFNSDYHLWQNQTQPIFQSKFVFALVLVFGLTLFSCSNDTEAMAMGEITTFITNDTQQNQIQSDSTNIDSTRFITNNANDSVPAKIISCDNQFEMGDIMIEEVPEIMTMGELVQEDVEEKFMTKGKISIEPNVQDTISTIESTPMISGMIDYPYTQEPQPLVLTDTTKNNVIRLTDKFEANLFPNPTQNKAKLTINVLVSENYNINIYDSQGRIIKAIYNGKLEVTTASFKLDLGNQNNGTYYISIETDSQNESLKIVKSN